MDRISNQKDVDSGLVKLLERCPNLESVASVAGPLPLRLQQPGFEGLARIIIGQQVSTASANAIQGRFLDRLAPVTPDRFLGAGEAAWIEIGLSRAKQAALSGLATELLNGNLDLDKLVYISSEEALSTLTALKGIGPWTAEVYLLFCAGHPDLFPSGDLALQEALRISQNLNERPTPRETREIAAQWAPWRGIAARLFWAYYKNVRTGRDGIPV